MARLLETACLIDVSAPPLDDLPLKKINTTGTTHALAPHFGYSQESWQLRAKTTPGKSDCLTEWSVVWDWVLALQPTAALHD